MPRSVSKLITLFLSIFIAITLNTQLYSFAMSEKSPELAKPGLVSDTGFYSGLQKLSPEEIHRLLPGTENKAIFLEFKSKFCYACKQMDPLLEELLPKYPYIEKRIFDMMKDKQAHAEVFKAFKPNVVPIQLYINTQGEIVNVFYDFHNKAELTASLDCINPGADGNGCKQLQSMLKTEETGLEKTIEHAFTQSLTGNLLLTILFAFFAGIISSFFPCTIAMLPVLVGYIGGYSGGSKKDVAMQVIMFTLGLASIMTVLGVVLSMLGKTFGTQSNPVIYVGIGLFCIIMALQMLEWIHVPMPQMVKQLPETRSGKLTSFYLLGCTFGLVASPCGTPVLAAILGIISKEGNILLGGVSLFAYAIGQSVLLVIVGLFTGLLKYKATLMAVGSVLNKVSAVVLIFIGTLFVLQGLGLFHL